MNTDICQDSNLTTLYVTDRPDPTVEPKKIIHVTENLSLVENPELLDSAPKLDRLQKLYVRSELRMSQLQVVQVHTIFFPSNIRLPPSRKKYSQQKQKKTFCFD